MYSKTSIHTSIFIAQAMKMLVMIRGVTTINNDIADCARASTVAQDRQALDTDIGALQTEVGVG